MNGSGRIFRVFEPVSNGSAFVFFEFSCLPSGIMSMRSKLLSAIVTIIFLCYDLVRPFRQLVIAWQHTTGSMTSTSEISLKLMLCKQTATRRNINKINLTRSK